VRGIEWSLCVLKNVLFIIRFFLNTYTGSVFWFFLFFFRFLCTVFWTWPLFLGRLIVIANIFCTNYENFVAFHVGYFSISELPFDIQRVYLVALQNHSFFDLARSYYFEFTYLPFLWLCFRSVNVDFFLSKLNNFFVTRLYGLKDILPALLFWVSTITFHARVRSVSRLCEYEQCALCQVYPFSGS